MSQASPKYQKLSLIDRWFNNFMGNLAVLGLGPRDMYLLRVHGRKSGKLYQLPVLIMPLQQRNYLVAPRGHTQWVRNARVAGAVNLKRGKQAKDYQVSELSGAEKPEILREYLNRYTAAVNSFFPISPDSDLAEFAAISDDFPVFELNIVN